VPQEIRAAECPAELADADAMGERRSHAPISVTASFCTPAAALTAYARSQDRITSLASGFQMHLVKPIDPLELLVAVSALAPRRIIR
jgi:CheY-like chemotaxis protein